jgi:subtilase family serine protease
MKRRFLLATVIPATAVAALTLATLASAASASTTRTAPQHGHQASDVKAACGTPAAGHARCLAMVHTKVHGGLGVRGRAARAAGEGAADTTLPTGYGPADLRSAYNLPSTGGSGQTVAIVDAYDDPTAESDLAVYRTTYGLSACTTANGCFTKVNQEGQKDSYPASDADTGWELETTLDLDMVSAVCPDCHILLVEGNSSSDADLAAAEDTAARMGATEISNSYGEDENFGMLPLEAAYSHPGIAITAATGDLGFRVPSFPAVAPSVIAVGGTMLQRDPGTAGGFTDTAWDLGGSGCSAWVAKPAWQTAVPDCPGRVTADVSAAADTDAYGFAIYDTTPSWYGTGWLGEGGTSASSPIIAGVIALAGNPGALPDASSIYNHSSGLNDVTSGYNGYFGFDCGGDNLCNAAPGYDGPTGLGTPNGTSAF